MEMLLRVVAVVGVLDDDFVGADAPHLVEHPLAHAVQLPFRDQGRELVVHHPQAPARGVGLGARLPVGEDLRRRGVLVAGAEGTKAPLDQLFLDDKIMGPFAPFSRDDYPAADDGVFAKLRHPGLLLIGRWAVRAAAVRPA